MSGGNCYCDNIVVQPNGDVTFRIVPTQPGGLPSDGIIPAADLQNAYVLTFAADVNAGLTTAGYNSFTLLAGAMAIEQGLITASQWATFIKDAKPVEVKGYTAYDTITGPEPTGLQVFSNPTTYQDALGYTPELLASTTVQAPAAQVEKIVSLPTTTANQVAVEKFYIAAFERAPEKGGLDYWTNLLDSGETTSRMGDIIFNLPIVKEIYADSMTNDQFVTAVYNNVFGKTPDAEGKSFWLNAMNGGSHRGDLVMNMINAGLGTPVGTEGRDYIQNRLDAVNYAVQNQIKSNVEIPTAKLLELTHNQGASALCVTTYNAAIDAEIVTLVGVTPATVV